MPEDRTVQVDVLPPRQLVVKPRSHLEQRSDAACHVDAAGGRISDPGEDLQQRALAGSIAADEADDLALLDLERHAVQCPFIVSCVFFLRAKQFSESSYQDVPNHVLPGFAKPVTLREIFDNNGVWHNDNRHPPSDDVGERAFCPPKVKQANREHDYRQR